MKYSKSEVHGIAKVTKFGDILAAQKKEMFDFFKKKLMST